MPPTESVGGDSGDETRPPSNDDCSVPSTAVEASDGDDSDGTNSVFDETGFGFTGDVVYVRLINQTTIKSNFTDEDLEGAKGYMTFAKEQLAAEISDRWRKSENCRMLWGEFSNSLYERQTELYQPHVSLQQTSPDDQPSSDDSQPNQVTHKVTAYSDCGDPRFDPLFKVEPFKIGPGIRWFRHKVGTSSMTGDSSRPVGKGRESQSTEPKASTTTFCHRFK